MLHAGYRVKVFRLRIDGRSDLAVIPLALGPWDNALHLLKVKGPRIAVVALLHGHGTAVEQGLALHTFWQHAGKLAQSLAQGRGDLLKWGERQRLLIDGVATEELIGALTGQDHLDVLAGLLGHEVQRHEGRIGHRVIQVPHDLRNRLGVFFRRDDLDDVLHADGCRRFRGHVHLGIAFALEASGKRQQIRVVALGQGSDGGGVDAARQERTHGDIGTHVLGDGILQRFCNAVKELLFFSFWYLLDRETRLKVALGDDLLARLQGHSAAGFHPADIGVQGFRFRDVLQVDIVLNSTTVKVEF